jgi:hypothetical protein
MVHDLGYNQIIKNRPNSRELSVGLHQRVEKMLSPFEFEETSNLQPVVCPYVPYRAQDD